MAIPGNNSVMNFLNEVAEAYPAAISLAAGRPGNQLFDEIDTESLSRWLATFRGTAPLSSLLQYGRTAGLIHELVARQITNDDGVPACADRMVVTAGCQEALALCVPELCREASDVLLVRNPCYIGITGAAAGASVALQSLDGNISGIDAQIESAVAQLTTSGRSARAVYLVPDFDNPTGEVISLEQRRAILAMCARHRIVVLEDNPYGMFRYEGTPIPPMAALDDTGCVIYFSTYSKTIAPTMRVGAVMLPESLFGDRGASVALYKAIVERKSFVTVNTSQLCQAIVGGLLIERDCSLRSWLSPTVEMYRRNRDEMLAQLAESFPTGRAAVNWNQPEGGFFLCVDVPMRFDGDAATECATRDGVIVLPMSFFAFDATQDQRIRLAFSAVEPDRIRAGIVGLSRFVARRVGTHVRREHSLAI
ncbi:PLP-dependent aminotransferase family protein [Rhodanobacter sp. AS-Z3]|uniref:aminotransferase-like domain-containing protein n=1 Tax=Rhodanobacter sp. AS-Z3 TaxID=3031330 RepID=UPI00247AF127|nr:PLP-dependent aminotransferase family protein [Rhodanobacter sp. AS-Z3]WEN15092.1 PLP-dependent aminotransferase family protein [Rhodanobacter sp. AS-Z3]